MSWGIFTLILLLVSFITGICMHISYMDRIHKRVSALSNCQISKDSIYEELSIPQGSNFNSIAASAWMLFFVSLAYLYFLTPSAFLTINYFRIPALASSPFGFLIFGISVSLLTSFISASFPGIYSFYDISKGVKSAFLLIFLLLGISLVCSAYIGTLYPMLTVLTDLAWMISFVTLLISELVLLSPIFIGFAKVMK